MNVEEFISSHLPLGLPKGFFPAGGPVKILKTLLPSSKIICVDVDFTEIIQRNCTMNAQSSRIALYL